VTRNPSKSLLNWLAGNNRPDASGYTAIDPARWEALSVRDYSDALTYLRGRFPAAEVTIELITTASGYCAGCVLRVGRRKYVVSGSVNVTQLVLFADGIAYTAAKRAKR
jgi:hypothetical protein